MFTGIVQGQALLTHQEMGKASASFTFNFPKGSLQDIQKGASIAINGTCLTVTEFNLDDSTANFDAIEETLRLTNLASLKIRDLVNFERAAKFGDEIGGHTMSGHIHSCIKIMKIEKTSENCRIYLALPEEIKPYIFNKGFVGVNGCSLTVAKVTDEYFSVHLIPETLELTTFGELSENNFVNIEIDSQTQAIVDTVKRVLLMNRV